MAATHCPGSEDIAALLDGALGDEERARLTEHLANCERCYELFVGGANFLADSREGGPGEIAAPLLLLPDESWDEESQPPAFEPAASEPLAAETPPFKASAPQRPFERPREARAPRSRGWWTAAALAATLAVAAGLLLLRWQRGGELSTERLASLAGGPGATAKVPWEGRVTRGPKENKDLPFEKESFRLGVRFLDLRLALASGDPTRADDSLRLLTALLGDSDFAPRDLISTLQAMQNQLRHGATPQTFLAATAARERQAIEELAAEKRLVELGGWTEACRLAGASGRPALFRDRATLRLLDRVVAADPKDEAALDAGAVEVVRGIRDEIAARRIDPAALGKRCQSLLEQLDYDY